MIGPWRHSGVNYDGSSLGALNFDGDTGLQFRDTMKPFLDRYLKDGAPTPTFGALTYATGVNKWQMSAQWPLGTQSTPLYLQADGGLG